MSDDYQTPAAESEPHQPTKPAVLIGALKIMPRLSFADVIFAQAALRCPCGFTFHIEGHLKRIANEIVGPRCFCCKQRINMQHLVEAAEHKIRQVRRQEVLN